MTSDGNSITQYCKKEELSTGKMFQLEIKKTLCCHTVLIGFFANSSIGKHR